jgi:hypothetical protein
MERRLVPHPDAVLRRVGNGAVLVHLGTGRVLELNETAARGWDLAAEGLTERQIASALAVEYSGDAATIERDLGELFTFLSAHGLFTS